MNLLSTFKFTLSLLTVFILTTGCSKDKPQDSEADPNTKIQNLISVLQAKSENRIMRSTYQNLADRFIDIEIELDDTNNTMDIFLDTKNASSDNQPRYFCEYNNIPTNEGHKYFRGIGTFNLNKNCSEVPVKVVKLSNTSYVLEFDNVTGNKVNLHVFYSKDNAVIKSNADNDNHSSKKLTQFLDKKVVSIETYHLIWPNHISLILRDRLIITDEARSIELTATNYDATVKDNIELTAKSDKIKLDQNAINLGPISFWQKSIRLKGASTENFNKNYFSNLEKILNSPFKIRASSGATATINFSN